jgi:hypothetical protein
LIGKSIYLVFIYQPNMSTHNTDNKSNACGCRHDDNSDDDDQNRAQSIRSLFSAIASSSKQRPTMTPDSIEENKRVADYLVERIVASRTPLTDTKEKPVKRTVDQLSSIERAFLYAVASAQNPNLALARALVGNPNVRAQIHNAGDALMQTVTPPVPKQDFFAIVQLIVEALEPTADELAAALSRVSETIGLSRVITTTTK